MTCETLKDLIQPYNKVAVLDHFYHVGKMVSDSHYLHLTKTVQVLQLSIKKEDDD